MYISPLSPVMEDALSDKQSGSITFLQASDSNTTADFLSEKLIDKLVRGEKTLVVLPTSYDREIPAKILAKHKLAHLSILWDANTSLEDKALERFKILSRLSEVSRDSHALEMVTAYSASIQKDLGSIVASYLQEIFDGMSVSEMIEYYCHDTPRAVTSSLLEDMNRIKDYSEVIHRLEGLEQEYESRFEFMESDLLDTSVFLSRESHIRSRNMILSLYNYAEEIKKEFEFAKAEALRPIALKIEAEAVILSTLLSELKDAYYTADIEQTNIESIINTSIKALSNLEHLKIKPVERGEDNHWNYLGHIIANIESTLNQLDHISSAVTGKYFKRLTPFNADSERLKAVLHQMEDLSSQLDDIDWLFINFSTQGLTLDSVQNDINNIWKHLKWINYLLNDGDYVRFKLAQNELNISDQILKILINEEAVSWKYSFIKLLLGCFISNNSKIGNLRFEELLAKSETLHKQVSVIVQDTIHNKWKKIRMNAMSQLKCHHEDLYHILFSADSTSLTLSNILHVDPDFLLSFYPIMVTTQDHLAELECFVTHWDNIIFYESSILSTASLQPWKEGRLEVSIVTSQAINLNQIQDKWETNLYFSHPPKSSFAQPFELLPRSERYQQAKNLALSILSVAPMHNIYRIKGKCIISLLNNSLNAKIVEILQDQDMNILYENSDESEALIEAMLTSDDEILLLHENGLLNYTQIKSFAWQKHILQLLQEAQIKLVNIDTLQLVKNCRATLHKLKKTISQSSARELVDEPLALSV